MSGVVVACYSHLARNNGRSYVRQNVDSLRSGDRSYFLFRTEGGVLFGGDDAVVIGVGTRRFDEHPFPLASG